MTDKHQPALGIMKTSEWPDAVSFRVACDCHDNSHDVDVWIEAERDDETREITITFYRELDTPFWEVGFNRFREAWRILWHGRSRFSGSLIIPSETAQHLCDAIQTQIARLKKS
jgi:hypothetical protein